MELVLLSYFILLKVDEIHTRTLHPHISLKNKLKSPHHDLNEYNELQENDNKSAKGQNLKIIFWCYHICATNTIPNLKLSSIFHSDATDLSDYAEDQHRLGNHVSFGGARHHSGTSGTMVENFEGTDASYQHKNHNNFYKNKESNYHDNKNIDMHKKQRWESLTLNKKSNQLLLTYHSTPKAETA